MALADGEESPLGQEEINKHLLQCAECREEFEQLRATSRQLSSQARLRPQVNLWPQVNERIQATTTGPSFDWRMLLLFGLPLFGYKFLLLLLQLTPGLWSRLIPVMLVIAIFGYLKTNPFKINGELTLEGEMTL